MIVIQEETIQKVAEVANKFLDRFDDLNKGIWNLAEKVEEVSQKLDGIKYEIECHGDQTEKVSDSVSKLTDTFSDIEKNLDSLNDIGSALGSIEYEMNMKRLLS